MRKVPDCGPRSALGRARIVVVVVAEQIVEEIARAAQRIGVLRAAIILRQRRQDRAALVFAIGAAEAAAAQPLQAGRDLVQIGPHLLDLVVDRTALRRLAGEQREEPGTVAAHALGLQGDAVEFGLLLGRGILVAADLIFLGRVAAAAAVDGRQLRFQPRAHRIDRRCPVPRRHALRRHRRRRIHLRGGVDAQRARADQRDAGQNPSGKGGDHVSGISGR